MKRFALVGLALALVAAAAPPAAAQQGGSLVVQVATEPPGLDLTTNPSSAIAAVIFYNVQEALVKVDKHGKLVPWLAERWYTTDSKNYTFFLRKGVRFHNGREVKAADIKFALDRAVNPETKHPYRVQYENIQDVIVKDDYTISVTLKRPEANFLWTVARQGSVIYPREAVESLKTQPLGTGPYLLSEWVRGDRVVLTRNKDYWQKGLPHLDKITFRFIADPNSALAALKSGDIDVSGFGLGPESVDELKKDGRYQVIVGDTTNDVTLSMNNSKKPYSDKRVRLAITHAINKEEVLKGAMFGYGLQRGPAQPVLRGCLQARALRSRQGQEAPGGGRLSQWFRCRVQGGAPVLLHRPQRRGRREPARQGGHPRQDPASRVGAVAVPGLLPEALREPRLRHVHHRPRRGVGHR